mmetsp:Transcript_104633/g.293220  ORF Transcript_104633/g.293220 Transcript_104633/m.293220 type:complete len:455 (-) Transcript_104633:119-1483(-)
MRAARVFTRRFAGWGAPQQTKLFPAIKRHSELVIEKGSGSEVFTVDGKRYLDATSGIGVVSTGHCHPTVVKAVQEQASKAVHIQQSCYYSSDVLKLIDRLQPLMPKGIESFFFANSGAEAVESALRLARQAKRRDTVVAFFGGYHGRTQGTLAITSSSVGYRGERAGPLPAGTAWARYPYEHAGVSAEQALESLDLILLQQAKASEIAAVIIEPVLGEGGYVVPPTRFMQGLREWCTQHDILLIADEVQAGFGRTGKQWAVENFGIVPDILVSAKGIASGYPLSMVATRPELSATQQVGCMGGTYGGNAVAIAAALATLDVFEQERVLENVLARGDQLMTGMRQMKAAASITVSDVRGLGLMVGCEFDAAITGKGFAHAVTGEAFDRGVLVLPTGHRETLRIIPPLTVTAAEIDELVHIVEESIAATYAKRLAERGESFPAGAAAGVSMSKASV